MPIRTAEEAREAAAEVGTGIAGELIVTLGSDGLVHRARWGRVGHHAVRPAPVVSAHGAGDVFVGALSARMAAPAAMEDAIAYGQAAAARFVSTPLEDRGILRASEGSKARAEQQSSVLLIESGADHERQRASGLRHPPAASRMR